MRVLGVINRSVQARGWHWNTDLDVPLTPDGAGEIVLAGTTLKVDPMDQNRDFVQRGTKLYNPRTQTYTFTSAIKCKVVVLLDFELLPENARYYIAVKAARSFQTTDLGSATLHQFTEADEQLALINLLQAEGDTRGATMLNDYNLASRLRRS
ncbi:hypothetical protein ASC76_19150 [Rhizobacter sp. Root404]|nr:hypothetical protein ASC76_19150 [Rhizobacter sp. Root404]